MTYDDFDDDLTVPMRQADQAQQPRPNHADDFDDDLTVPMRQASRPAPQPSHQLDDFDDDLTVPMRQRDRAHRPPSHPPKHVTFDNPVDDFDDDVTIPVRPVEQPLRMQAAEPTPPAPPLTSPGNAELWTPPPRPTQTAKPAESLTSATWLKPALVTAAIVAALVVAATLFLTGGETNDGDQAPTAEVEDS